MPRPRFDDIADLPLTTDEAVLGRVDGLLVEGALRRQLWLLLLDEDDRQLPVLMPCDVPARPAGLHTVGFRRMVGMLADEFAVSSIVVVLERPGPPRLSPGDRAWCALVDDACRAAGMRLRGPLLCHDGGTRWVAAEDYLVKTGTTPAAQ